MKLVTDGCGRQPAPRARRRRGRSLLRPAQRWPASPPARGALRVTTVDGDRADRSPGGRYRAIAREGLRRGHREADAQPGQSVRLASGAHDDEVRDSGAAAGSRTGRRTRVGLVDDHRRPGRPSAAASAARPLEQRLDRAVGLGQRRSGCWARRARRASAVAGRRPDGRDVHRRAPVLAQARHGDDPGRRAARSSIRYIAYVGRRRRPPRRRAGTPGDMSSISSAPAPGSNSSVRDAVPCGRGLDEAPVVARRVLGQRVSNGPPRVAVRGDPAGRATC